MTAKDIIRMMEEDETLRENVLRYFSRKNVRHSIAPYEQAQKDEDRVFKVLYVEEGTYLLCKAIGTDNDEPIDVERTRYFYEEHFCPINNIGDVIEVVSPDNPDPHGAFLWVGTVPRPSDEEFQAFARGEGLGGKFWETLNDLISEDYDRRKG